MSGRPKISEVERDLMEHATGWRSREPLYRNYFAAAVGTADWLAWCSLQARGLAETMVPANQEALGSYVFFGVTPLGLIALGRGSGRRRKRSIKS